MLVSSPYSLVIPPTSNVQPRILPQIPNLPCKKNKFTPSEDEKLKYLVSKFGTDSWSLIGQLMQTRNARQCRERWNNYLNPTLSTEPWSFEEDQLLAKKFAELGPQWNKLSKFFNNRSDNNIRNRWHFLLRQFNRKSLNHVPEEPNLSKSN